MSRRTALKLLAAAGVWWAARAPGAQAALKITEREPAATALNSMTVAALDAWFAPFPGKQALLHQTLKTGDAALPEMLAAAMRGAPLVPQANRRLVSLHDWPVGHGPNYTHAAVVGGRRRVWAACFASGVVSAIDVDADRAVDHETGPMTNPLDVSYDAARKRVVVASADAKAKMIVLDARYQVLSTLELTMLLDQGESKGGAQGVTIDADGNYWFALAYYSQWHNGALVKIDGETLEPLLVVREFGINNPNGIVTNHAGDRIFAFADNGYGFELDLDGAVQHIHKTVDLGYRGTVVGDELWVCGWLLAGRMARINLTSGERQVFPCIPLANSVQVDTSGNIWVAGDAGVSVSSHSGQLLAVGTFGAFTNGLSIVDNQAFLVSYDSRLHHATDDLLYLPLAAGVEIR